MQKPPRPFPVSVRVAPAANSDTAAENFHFTALPPLALYVHIPWCVRKCPYCDFNSHEVKDAIPERAYIDALIADLEFDLPRVWGRKLKSIFIGGGTPSLFSPESIDQLLCAVRARLPFFSPAIEVTLEANPGTVEQGKFAELRAAGVNRLSIGVQSFDADALERLGRIHGAKEASRAAEQAHAAGFDNFNLDLMFGLPGQTSHTAANDVATAIALEPTHLSYYQLTLEPNTQFAARPPSLPEDDVIAAIQERGQHTLAEHGYAQYEVSAYARAEKQCAHNLNYWTFGDYLGIGAGAHAKISDAQTQRIQRLWKVKSPRDYLAAVPASVYVGGESTLTPADAGFEFMMNALRLNDGFEIRLFAERTGLTLSVIEVQLTLAQRKGWIEVTSTHIRATEHGRRYLNDVLEGFLPEPNCRVG
jgi:oxygen-independent coproporphyrinogen-3 oxidase